MTRYTYTPADIEYAIANYNKLDNATIAAHIGVTSAQLRQQVFRWRQAGYEFTPPQLGALGRKAKGIGEKTLRNRRGKMVEFIKTEAGWKGLYPEPRAKAVKRKPKPKKTIKKTVPKRIPAVKLPAKLSGISLRQVKQFKTREPDLSNKLRVYIPEKRMCVYAPIGSNVEAVKAKYREHYEFMSKRKTV